MFFAERYCLSVSEIDIAALHIKLFQLHSKKAHGVNGAAMGPIMLPDAEDVGIIQTDEN
jgi:hypothetical protein